MGIIESVTLRAEHSSMYSFNYDFEHLTGSASSMLEGNSHELAETPLGFSSE